MACAHVLSIDPDAGNAPVWVQAFITPGTPFFSINGLPGMPIDDVRARIRQACETAGMPWPRARVTVILSQPARPKNGTIHDLAIAASILAAAGMIDPDRLDGMLLVGGLDGDGRILPVDGMDGILAAALRQGATSAILPSGSQVDKQDAPGMGVRYASRLQDLIGMLTLQANEQEPDRTAVPGPANQPAGTLQAEEPGELEPGEPCTRCDAHFHAVQPLRVSGLPHGSIIRPVIIYGYRYQDPFHPRVEGVQWHGVDYFDQAGTLRDAYRRRIARIMMDAIPRQCAATAYDVLAAQSMASQWAASAALNGTALDESLIVPDDFMDRWLSPYGFYAWLEFGDAYLQREANAWLGDERLRQENDDADPDHDDLYEEHRAMGARNLHAWREAEWIVAHAHELHPLAFRAASMNQALQRLEDSGAKTVTLVYDDHTEGKRDLPFGGTAQRVWGWEYDGVLNGLLIIAVKYRGKTVWQA